MLHRFFKTLNAGQLGGNASLTLMYMLCPHQVHTICADALAKSPSCPPALAALVEYYISVAEASVKYIVTLKKSFGGGGLVVGSQEVEEVLAPARAAVRAAVGHAASLLDGLSVADPIRTMYWMQRQRVLQQLEAQAESGGMDGDSMQA